MVDKAKITRLSQYAYDHRITSKEASHGLCFYASIGLAREAKALGLDDCVRFVHWRVRGDLSFLEHWAVMVDGTGIMDLTAAQVDGDSHPFRQAASYPENYTDRREYPMDLVLHSLRHSGPNADGRYPRGTVWGLHKAMGQYDIRQALVQYSPGELLAAFGGMGKACLLLAAGCVLEAAIRRLGRLLVKLD